jgi:arginine deiminase
MMQIAHGLGVHSEVGQLSQAIVHRPGLELSRLSPKNCDELPRRRAAR